MPSEISSLMDIDDNLKEKIWVTIIALAFMEKKYSELREEWKLIAEKSIKYIKKSLHNDLIIQLLEWTKNNFLH